MLCLCEVSRLVWFIFPHVSNQHTSVYSYWHASHVIGSGQILAGVSYSRRTYSPYIVYVSYFFPFSHRFCYA